MTPRPTAIERAYQLAKNGEHTGVATIKLELKREGFADVDAQLYGPTMRMELRKLCERARAH